MILAILVTGSRDETSAQRIKRGLVAAARMVNPGLQQPIEAVRMVHGGAPGADTTAAQIGIAKGWAVESWPAKWRVPRQKGDPAGSIRNGEMVARMERLRADGWTVVCAAFPLPGSIGTHDCVRKARKAGIPVYEEEVPTLRGEVGQ